MPKYEYKLIPGFFVQDDHEYSTTHQISPSFGLNDADSPTRWADFKAKIAHLHAEKRKHGDAWIKVFFVGRHGQGWHNVGGTKYELKDWESHWSKLNGDGEIVWGPDPELTPQGKQEAHNVNEAWKKELPQGMPLPDRWFASPFQRACNTLRITFDGVADPKPMIVEEMREMIGMHTCDKRSPKSIIAQRFPTFAFEEGFAEQDELWTTEHRETEDEMVVRAARGLDKLMELTTEDDVYVSISAHTGIARALMAAVGHRRYDLPTGGVLPMVVAVTRA